MYSFEMVIGFYLHEFVKNGREIKQGKTKLLLKQKS